MYPGAVSMLVSDPSSWRQNTEASGKNTVPTQKTGANSQIGLPFSYHLTYKSLSFLNLKMNTITLRIVVKTK